MTIPGVGVLSDYGDNIGANSYCYESPDSLDALVQVISIAAQSKKCMRPRGNGHSMNGSSLPREGELLIDMGRMSRYVFESPDTVTVEAGAAVWDVNLMLKQYGFELLVYNDGNAAASSLGGYVSAGGIGYTSNVHGGFWNSVEAITFVTAAGEVRSISRKDTVFRWFFGSMGQFGVIAKVRLRISAIPGCRQSEVYGISGSVKATAHDWESIVWFTLFVPKLYWKVARSELLAIKARHTRAWLPRVPYVYRLPFQDFVPPLIHPFQGDLVAVGLWGEAPEDGFDWQKISAIDAEVQALVDGNSRIYRRYAQTERVLPGFYRDYFDAGVFSHFRQLKSLLDPDDLLSRGVF
jgi:FAD/FMN-containing dehydrogenase